MNKILYSIDKEKRVKRIYIILTAFVISFLASWYIGQKLHTTDKSVSQQESVEMDSDTNSHEGIAFEGQVDTSDNPWGTTAGMIEMEDESECIFLTPNTAVYIEQLDNLDKFTFITEIHPWVRSESDGAGLVLSVLGENNEVLHEEKIIVNSKSEWQEYEFDLETSANKIKFACNNGENGDDTCDWVIIKIQSPQNMAIDGDEENVFSLLHSVKMPSSEGGYQITDGFNGELPVLETVENTWESVDVLNPSVIRWKGMYYNYYSGWDSNVWRTGLAVSEDGVNWTKKADNPILDTRSDGWDSSYIAANGSAVVFHGKVFYFYQGKMADTNAAAIGLAISKDGEQFEDRTDEPVLVPGGGYRVGLCWSCRSLCC